MTTPLESKRILSFVSPSVRPEIAGGARYINYRGNRVELSQEQLEELCSKFPAYWYSEKDKIIHFTVTEDNICFCEREKIVYNYATRNSESKRYIFDGATVEQIIQLKDIILAFFEKLHVNQVTEIQNKIVQGISHLAFLKVDFLRMRHQFLQASDYLMMPDYPLTDEERTQWTEYRQALRDIPQQEAWKSGKYLDVIFPAAPNIQDQIQTVVEYFKNRGVDYTKYKSVNPTNPEELKEFMNGIATVTARKGIVDTLVRLGIPSINKIFYPNFAEFTTEEDLYLNNDIETVTAKSIESLVKFNEYKQQIDEELAKLDVNMTIDDIVREAEKVVKNSDDLTNLLDDLTEETND
jgi:hypothetical protein